MPALTLEVPSAKEVSHAIPASPEADDSLKKRVVELNRRISWILPRRGQNSVSQDDPLELLIEARTLVSKISDPPADAWLACVAFEQQYRELLEYCLEHPTQNADEHVSAASRKEDPWRIFVERQKFC